MYGSMRKQVTYEHHMAHFSTARGKIKRIYTFGRGKIIRLLCSLESCYSHGFGFVVLVFLFCAP
jgi:hypothetical protein